MDYPHFEQLISVVPKNRLHKEKKTLEFYIYYP